MCMFVRKTFRTVLFKRWCDYVVLWITYLIMKINYSINNNFFFWISVTIIKQFSMIIWVDNFMIFDLSFTFLILNVLISKKLWQFFSWVFWLGFLRLSEINMIEKTNMFCSDKKKWSIPKTLKFKRREKRKIQSWKISFSFLFYLFVMLKKKIILHDSSNFFWHFFFCI